MNTTAAGASPVDQPVRPDPVRDAFETWVTAGGKWPQAARRIASGSYWLMATHTQWTAWQASAAAERERLAKLCEQADKSAHPADLADAIRRA